ncbi:hypothetical protein, partial [Aeromonas dhakensis]|uniref:hypothetical protein n=1 Tax=Aeromonas dhakensis TaxID=196024 RepID=UPI001F3A40FC
MENTLNFRKRYPSSIGNLENLLSALDITEQEYIEFNALPLEERYKEFHIPKSDGTSRHVYSPHKLVRKIQRRIVRRIFRSPAREKWEIIKQNGGAIIWLYGDSIHLTVAHKREWSYGFKPDNKTVPLPCYPESPYDHQRE